MWYSVLIPYPTSYYDTHTALGTWKNGSALERLRDLLADEKTRLDYN